MRGRSHVRDREEVVRKVKGAESANQPCDRGKVVDFREQVKSRAIKQPHLLELRSPDEHVVV